MVTTPPPAPPAAVSATPVVERDHEHLYACRCPRLPGTHAAGQCDQDTPSPRHRRT